MSNKNIIPVGLYGHFIDIEAIIEAAKGETGKSAYDIAVENGFTGDEKEWLETLKGRSTIDVANTKITAHMVFDKDNNVKYTPLKLSRHQRDTALNNIGAASKEDAVEAFTTEEIASAIDETVVTEAVRYTALETTPELQTIAQQNLNVADASRVEALELNVAKLKRDINPDLGEVSDISADIQSEDDTVVGAVNKLNSKVGSLDDIEIENKSYTSLVSAINLLASGCVKYKGTIYVEASTTSLASLSPIKVGYLYNVVGVSTTINGITFNNGDWVLATADTEPNEEPTFIKFIGA